MNNLVIALEITALGMGLVFAAIMLLWWMMVLLTALTSDKDTSSSIDVREADTTGSTEVVDCDMKAKAAAVAVAIALAEGQASLAHLLVEPPTTLVSAWQLGMRTRQLYEKPTPIIRKPRKIG
jgi:Na+-transporting methylmalonyl-CoA/oxaloacetate decarboxylase gamma subunit